MTVCVLYVDEICKVGWCVGIVGVVVLSPLYKILKGFSKPSLSVVSSVTVSCTKSMASLIPVQLCMWFVKKLSRENYLQH